ncbi:MAG: undecaprenyldiphospho-muramoylpentapeptide beta-N-acetylglucosaminyltransferase [Phycisphaerales bacterium]|nr:undecaprenyldiphospho-muramoylpentapeptide beta-N-acetylglucosaminyltransferase [Phycisphaerales bacterium]
MTTKIIIAGGGTGGHIFPALSIASKLQSSLPSDILFVGDKNRMEMQKIPQAGFSIVGISIAGFNRSHFWKNILLPFKVLAGFFQVALIFKRFKPQVVIGVGGYSSFPVLCYAQWKNIPTFIHESNSLSGKANRWLSKRATAIFVAYKNMEQYFPKDKIYVSGNPVRQAIVASTITRTQGIDFFNLNPDCKTILFIGGSLGAKGINETVAEQYHKLSAQRIQIIWQTGNTTFADYQSLTDKIPYSWIGPFIDKMEYAYAAADVIVSRAGAMALSELAIVGKPIVLVPYPFAAEDHQRKNAEVFVDNQAAMMILDKDLKNKLMDTLLQLFDRPEALVSLSTALKTQAIQDADARIVHEIMKYI